MGEKLPVSSLIIKKSNRIYYRSRNEKALGFETSRLTNYFSSYSGKASNLKTNLLSSRLHAFNMKLILFSSLFGNYLDK